MTVVVAIARDGAVHMAADTQTTCGHLAVLGLRKIRRVRVGDDGEALLLAGAGNPALLQVACRSLGTRVSPPIGREAETLDAWVENLASTVTTAAATHDPPITESGGSCTTTDGNLIVGFRGRLWMIATHSAIPVADGIAAIGSGGDIALGVVHTVRLDTERVNAPLDVPRALQRAVRMACYLDAFCSIENGRVLDIHTA